jgi:hypothetical protein
LHHHRDVAPPKADIGVMTFGLGELAHLLNERPEQSDARAGVLAHKRYTARTSGGA